MRSVSTQINFGELDAQVLDYWKEKDICNRSMQKDADIYPSIENDSAQRDAYVFYDGPPFATGLPHYGHLLAGTIKDVIGRFFTMKGKWVDRRFGWDCHGVPVEFEIQKSLDLHGQKAILEFGIDKFNEECRKIVNRYSAEWREFVVRSGRWVDFEREYRTMDLSYMESIWWVIGELWKKGLIYEGFKCVPYSWAINTPLSNFEANLNYKNIQDPAISVRFSVPREEVDKLAIRLPENYSLSLYAWTTTPWTLPSNMGLAVGEDIDYLVIDSPDDREYAIVARGVLEKYFPELANREAPEIIGTGSRVIDEIKGRALVGIGYTPLFDYFAEEKISWCI